MLDELKLIVEAIAGLPQITMYVLIGFLIYKLAVVGSIFGVIKVGIEKLHDFSIKAIERKNAPKVTEVDIQGVIEGMCITQKGAHRALVGQLERIRGKGTGINSEYIHSQSVVWLKEAIDAKELEESEKAAEK